MRGRTALGAIAVVAVAAPILLLAAAVARVHWYARKAVANADPAGSTVVVFGAQALESGPAKALRGRLDHALELYRARPGRRLAMAGGVPASRDTVRGGHDEVAAMVAYARERGVPEQDLIAVRPGQNTREQVASTRRLVVDAGLGPVIGVSSSYHLARICDEARRQGFDIEPAASATGADVERPRQYLVHLVADALGLIWYALPAAVSERLDTSAGTFRHVGVGLLTGHYGWRELRRRG